MDGMFGDMSRKRLDRAVPLECKWGNYDRSQPFILDRICTSKSRGWVWSNWETGERSISYKTQSQAWQAFKARCIEWAS